MFTADAADFFAVGGRTWHDGRGVGLGNESFWLPSTGVLVFVSVLVSFFFVREIDVEAKTDSLLKFRCCARYRCTTFNSTSVM